MPVRSVPNLIFDLVVSFKGASLPRRIAQLLIHFNEGELELIDFAVFVFYLILKIDDLRVQPLDLANILC